MKNLLKRYLPLFLSLIILLNFNPVNAASFNEDLREIRTEINRDNLQEAIKKIKKIKISNENEQEKIDLLFGDIYLKINQIDKAEEFYQKTFFTSNEEIEARTFIGNVKEIAYFVSASATRGLATEFPVLRYSSSKNAFPRSTTCWSSPTS